MNNRDHWRDIYSAKPPEALSWFEVSPSSSLDALDRIGADYSRSIVDVGGGTSRLADALLDRDWRDITVVDIADTALEGSRKRLGTKGRSIEWQVADIRHWLPVRTFAIWHDRAVFHFLTQARDRALYKRALAAGTQAGSHTIIATFAADGPEKCSGLPVRRYDAAALAAEFEPGFALVDDWRSIHITPWGGEQAFQWCTFIRR